MMSAPTIERLPVARLLIGAVTADGAVLQDRESKGLGEFDRVVRAGIVDED